MRLKFRIDSKNPTHVHFTVFVDGQNCGHLCMDPESFALFKEMIDNGICTPDDEFQVTPVPAHLGTDTAGQ